MAFGFKETTSINLNVGDSNKSETRLSWHNTESGGFSHALHDNLTFSENYSKIIMKLNYQVKKNKRNKTADTNSNNPKKMQTAIRNSDTD